MTLSTLACTVDANGISAPTYVEILGFLQDTFRSIYGSDAYLEADSQDGQLLAIFASAVNDSNAATIATYNAFSPATAQGAGLASVVKANGITKGIPTASTAEVTLVGQAGTVIQQVLIGDDLNLGTQWEITGPVTIPGGGSATATAICITLGGIAAAPNTLTRILTPTIGWQTVTNAASATLGAPVETDAALRRRQSTAAALPASSPVAGVYAALLNVAGVQAVAPYENDTGSADGNGIPAHSISMVVRGGTDQDVADAIGLKKPPGTGTYGSTTANYTDPKGLPKPINFYRPTDVSITVQIDITRLAGWALTTQDTVKASVAAYINALAIGDDVLLTKLYTPANLTSPLGDTFDITAIRMARSGSPTAANVTIAFNELATCDVADITVNLT